jgi:hypothetical protein
MKFQCSGVFPQKRLLIHCPGPPILKHYHFISILFYPAETTLAFPPPSGARVDLPALTCLKYRGTSKFLDSLVARIDAPRLKDIDTTFSSQPTMDASQLGRFICRIEMQLSLDRANVKLSGRAISISFTGSTPLRLQIPCKPLDWQLSSMAQMCDQCSPFLFRVNNLGINTTISSSGQDDVDGEQWLALFRAFHSARTFWVTGELTTDILCAFGKADGEHANVLPALRHLRVGSPLAMYGPSWDAVRSFLAARWISSHPVRINAPSYLCHICRGTFEEKEELRSHLVLSHLYRIVCSYCGDLERIQLLAYEELLREHIASKHLNVSPTDMLRASDLFELFTKLKPSVSPDETGTSTDADTDANPDANPDADTDVDTDVDMMPILTPILVVQMSMPISNSNVCWIERGDSEVWLEYPVRMRRLMRSRPRPTCLNVFPCVFRPFCRYSASLIWTNYFLNF